MARAPRFDAVLFDVGETLIGPAGTFGASYARHFRELGIDAPDARWDAVMRRQWRRLALAHPPGADRYRLAGGELAFWQALVAAVVEEIVGRPPADGLVRRATERLYEHFLTPGAWRIYDEVPEVLARLEACGVALGVVSNWDSRLEPLLDRLGLARHFAVICGSHRAGVEKPDPRLFDCALGRLGVAPRRALHVGDLPETDWSGARAAGCAVRLVDRRGRLGPLWAALRDLRALPRLVAERQD
ncbi:MAG: HAD-IA family hydrolase [Acidobacteriota bacterium]